MTGAKHSCVVGVFDEPHAAEQAAAELRCAGFREDQVAVVQQTPKRASDRGLKAKSGKKHETGVLPAVTGFFKKLFGSQEDAHHYRSELKAGRTIVTVKGLNGEHEQVLTILKGHGGYNKDLPKPAAAEALPLAPLRPAVPKATKRRSFAKESACPRSARADP
jgi:hypothetical protein